MRTKMEAANWWIQMAKEDREVIKVLLRSRKYLQVLFFCHLHLEKLLKAAYILQKDEAPPYMHDLEKIALKAGIRLTNGQVKDLKFISQFNISGRYPEEKMDLYEKASEDLVEEVIKLTEKYSTWIERSFLQKRKVKSKDT